MPIYIYKKLIKENFEIIKKKTNSNPAIVLKSNAYSLGLTNIIQILEETTCEKIFVHNLEEALEIRAISNKFQLILFGSIKNLDHKIYKNYNILPTLNGVDDLIKKKEVFFNTPIVLNIDIGMNRTGLKLEEIKENIDLLKNLNIKIVMSHLHITSSKEVDPINLVEKELFEETVEFLKKNHIIKEETPLSLASSNVIDFGKEYIFSFPRIGKALYGLTHKDYGLKQAIELVGEISSVKKVGPGEIVGYNGYKIFQESYLGIVEIGYAHGLFLQYIDNLNISYKGNLYKIISISMEYIIIDFQNTIPQVGENLTLFPNGLVKDCGDSNIYYLEQLLRFNLLKKIVV